MINNSNAKPAAHRASTETITILIVDDDPDFCAFLRSVLEMENYRVITASNGLEALKLLIEEQPSLVLTGYHAS